jgi:GDP-L-fucose synthase
MTTSPLTRDSRVYIAGHRGLVGSAMWRHLEAEGFTDLVGRTSSQLDLRDRDATFAFIEQSRPQVIVMAAARVGGILANSTYPADFLSDNLQVQVNVFDAAGRYDVERLLFLGSSCIYPRLASQPIREDSLMTGPLEPTNDAYAIAKIAGILHAQAMRRQYQRHYISAMPTNLYGPNDNFDLQSSHVLPAMIRRFHEAKRDGTPSVTLWGTGSPRREFLHVDDMASASLFLLDHYDEPGHVNVGVGEDVTIKELAETIARVVGYEGELQWDRSKPDGMPRKLLDVSRLNELGWKARTGLVEGITSTYRWYVEQEGSARR